MNIYLFLYDISVFILIKCEYLNILNNIQAYDYTLNERYTIY